MKRIIIKTSESFSDVQCPITQDMYGCIIVPTHPTRINDIVTGLQSSFFPDGVFMVIEEEAFVEKRKILPNTQSWFSENTLN